jgi:hypothetical protein
MHEEKKGDDINHFSHGNETHASKQIRESVNNLFSSFVLYAMIMCCY